MPAFLRLLTVLAVLAAIAPGRASFAETPESVARTVIESFYATLLATMKQGEQLGFRGRYEALEPAILKAYDMERMSLRVLGPSVARMTRQDVDRMKATFTRLNVTTYASRFKKFGGEKFVVGNAQAVANIGVLVESQIVTSKGEAVTINYLLTQESGDWRINDVYLKGTISEVATRRSEYAGVLRQSGIDGLIGSIEERIAAIEAEQ
ncbi:MAG: ABC transporter substrate-binding protein [Alphaproteobacteria bacterium]|nr:ABC transporter substrate-binding protein [Alphaproteobacteria bacterium]